MVIILASEYRIARQWAESEGLHIDDWIHANDVNRILGYERRTTTYKVLHGADTDCWGRCADRYGRYEDAS